jgi:hypothetical protein
VAQALQQRSVLVRELRMEMPSLEEFFYSVTEGADRREELAARSAGGAA